MKEGYIKRAIELWREDISEDPDILSIFVEDENGTAEVKLSRYIENNLNTVKFYSDLSGNVWPKIYSKKRDFC